MKTLGAPGASRVVGIRRKAAIGDVLMATPLAKRFADFGCQVKFKTLPGCAGILHGLPFLTVSGPDEPAAVVLDKTYEMNMHFKTKSVGEMFFDAAAPELRRRGIPVEAVNLRPHIALSKQEIMLAAQHMASMPRPWVVLCTRSVAWKTRTLNPSVWNMVVPQIPGSVFIGITDLEQLSGNPGNLKVTDWARTIREFAAVIANADLVITVDTGPMHIAAALGKPIVAIEQSISINFRLNNQVDYAVVGSLPECSPCNEFACNLPGFKDAPPCQWCEPMHLLWVAKEKLDILTNGKVSAIIPVYKDTPRIARCIGAVKHQVNDIIVPLDGTCTLSSNPKLEDVLLLEAPGKRLGYGKNCQRAARLAKGEYLLFLNDDCYLDGNAVERMKQVLKNNADVAVVGCLLRYPDGKIQHGGMFRSKDGYGHIDHMKAQGSIREVTEMEAVTFAAALVRRSAFFEVGGFDEEYDCYSEDVDLCLKLRRAGWKVMYQPAAMGLHEESQSTTAEKQKMLAASHVILRRKWGAFFSGNPLGQLGKNFSGTQ